MEWAILHDHPVCPGALVIGVVAGALEPGVIAVQTAREGERILDLPSWESLPQIC